MNFGASEKRGWWKVELVKVRKVVVDLGMRRRSVDGSEDINSLSVSGLLVNQIRKRLWR